MSDPSQQAQYRYDMAFVGIPSFLRAPICTNLEDLDADIAVLGIPTDEGSPFMPGSRFGPRKIREHSIRFGKEGFRNPETGERFLVSEMTNRRLVDVGDVDVLPTNVAATFKNITDSVRAIFRCGAMPVIIGGDHAITFPVVRALDSITDLHIFHLDAHLDYAHFTNELELTNAHPFRHIRQMPNVKTLTQVGIRSLRMRETVEDSTKDGNLVITMEAFRKMPIEKVISAIPRDAKCYVSIDVDVFDPPLVPGTVSAEPNGMSYAEVRDTLKGLAEKSEVIGFDLVEVNPQLDIGTGVTSYLAAHTIIEFLGHICAQPRWRNRASRST